jgi:hypothetical protein
VSTRLVEEVVSIKKLRIVTDNYVLRKTGVELDGVMYYPESLKLEMGIDRANTLTMKLIVKEVDLGVPVIVEEANGQKKQQTRPDDDAPHH